MEKPISAVATELSSVVEPLLAWYDAHRRSLPWRDDPTPYHVWLSEIMLQQTRIEAVLPYYTSFLSVCPTVETLAAIEDEILMKLWEGLGYYSRARNLKRAAQVLTAQYGGILPADYQALRQLPGIGAYTAGAIASIAFGLPEPAVDGNVLRVVTRLTADHSDITKESTKQAVIELLRTIYPRTKEQAAAMTQAIMELGQRLCIPNGEPHCQDCPLGAFCRANAEQLTDIIPVKTPKKPRKIQPRTIFLFCCGDKVALHKRESRGLLAGLWEFPGVDGHLNIEEAKIAADQLGVAAKSPQPISDAVHIFTHIEWHMKAYLVPCTKESPNFTWVTKEQLAEEYALPGAFHAYRKILFLL